MKKTETELTETKITRLFKRACAEHLLLEDGDRVLVAVSGGKDSLELVRLFSRQMRIHKPRIEAEAAHVIMDNIPYETKTSRLNEIIALQGRMSLKSNEKEIGKVMKVLVEGPSKRNPEELCGRAGSNKMCVFPSRGEKPGDYCEVEVVSVTSATLLCKRID